MKEPVFREAVVRLENTIRRLQMNDYSGHDWWHVDITETSTNGSIFAVEESENDENDGSICNEDRDSDDEENERDKHIYKSNSWRIHIADVFDRRDLGAVMHSKGIQQFVQPELRRALYYLFKMTETDDSIACASLFAQSDYFPGGEVKICPRCDIIGVDNRRCTCCVVCEYCGWFGHTIQSCPQPLAPKSTLTVAAAVSATEPQQQKEQSSCESFFACHLIKRKY